MWSRPVDQLRVSSLAEAGRKAMAGLWAILLIATLLTQAANAWLVVDRNFNILPSFGSVGLTAVSTGTGWMIMPAVAFGDGTFVPAGRLVSVDDRPVGGRSASEVASWLRGADGTATTLVILDADTPRTVVLTRTEVHRSAVEAQSGRRTEITKQSLDLLTALALIAAAVLLRWRRSESGVSWVFSFAFLVLGAVGCEPLWASLDLYILNNAIDAAWLSLFLIAVPALPTGRYLPRWTRWVVILGPLLSLGLIRVQLNPILVESCRLALITAALACVALRFASTPAGAERQQLKWASLGLSAGLLMFGAGIVLYFAGTGYWPPISLQMTVLLQNLGYGLHRSSMLVMAAGVLVCLMDYRLNDADAAVGRSAGYALLTTLIAVIWAVGGAWINRAIGFITGNGDPTLSTALSTLIALSLLAPAQSRILSWTEARFQRALVRLRTLPDRLSAWRHGDDPRSVARGALALIVDGVNADQGAVVLINEAGRLDMLATHNVTEAVVVEALDRSPEAEGLGLFQLSLPLTTDDGGRGLLLLGRRSDGAGYRRDERAAIAAVLAPLSLAISVTALRAAHKAELMTAITSMETRIAGIEAGRGDALLPA